MRSVNIDPLLERRRKPRLSPLKRGLLIVWIMAALGILVYSGTAWLWLRPAIYKELINKYSGEYKMDPLWVMSLIRVESSFARSAESPRGAVGLMQLLPSTAKELAQEVGMTDFKEDDLKNPDVNIHLGVHYLMKLQQQFPDDEVSLLSAYNAGPNITQQWRRGKPVLEMGDIPYKETRMFVRRVHMTYGFLKSLQRWKHLFGIE